MGNKVNQICQTYNAQSSHIAKKTLSDSLNLRLCYLSPTMRCNATCKFCSVWKGSTQLSLNECKKVICEFADLNGDILILSGGECCYYPGFAELLEIIKTCSVRWGMITNGSALMQPNFNILKEAQPSYIVYSRDFPTPEKQAAMRGINICDDEIISSLRILKTQGALLQINTVLFSDNYEQLLQFIEHPAIQEIDFWHLIPVKGKMQKCWSNTSSLRLINTILPELEDRLRNKSVQLFFPDLQTSQPPFEAVTVGHKNRPIQCTFKDVSLNVLPDKSVYTCNCFDWKDRMLFKLGSIDRHSLADCIRRRKTPNFISGLSKTLCLFCDPINDNLEHLLTNES